MNEGDGNYYVAVCGLTKKQAEKLTGKLIEKGILARCSPHVKRRRHERRT